MNKRVAGPSRPCLFFDYTLGPEKVASQGVALKLGMKVQKRSMFAGSEYLILYTARDSSIDR